MVERSAESTFVIGEGVLGLVAIRAFVEIQDVCERDAKCANVVDEGVGVEVARDTGAPGGDGVGGRAIIVVSVGHNIGFRVTN